jgi:hypothetical protein
VAGFSPAIGSKGLRKLSKVEQQGLNLQKFQKLQGLTNQAFSCSKI